jgi:hypothetical protein
MMMRESIYPINTPPEFFNERLKGQGSLNISEESA